MTLTGTKSGNFQLMANCAGVTANQSLAFLGSAGPSWGITAPAALAGTVLSQGGETLTINDPNTLLSNGQVVAVFWYVAGILHAMFDVTINTITSPGASETVLLTVTNAKFLIGADSTLPANGTAITIAVAQDITDDVSLTGSNVQQLLATSTQVGLVEWLDGSANQNRLSSITAAGGFDGWPTAANQSLSWTNPTTKLRCYNQATTTASMQVAAVLT
jgi:hypothetical protein